MLLLQVLSASAFGVKLEENAILQNGSDDFSHIGSYMELIDYVRDLDIIPCQYIYNLIENNNIYVSLGNHQWYISDNNHSFNTCYLPINDEIHKSIKLTNKINSLKTFKNNTHLLNLLKLK